MEEKILSEVSVAIAADVYKDTAGQSVKPIGTVLGLLPRTVRLWFSGWEKWIINGEVSIELTAEALKDKLSKVPAENLCEPDAFVAIPAIQQLGYCTDSEELRNMYANLLASSMNSDTKWQVHPAFVDIIKQLSPDEAKIIKSIPNLKNNFIPLVDVKLYDKDDPQGTTGHQLYITNFTTLGLDTIENKHNICGYIDNLIRLNILQIPGTYTLHNKENYTALETNRVLNELIPVVYKQMYNIGYNQKSLIITNFGLQFKNICCQ